MEEKNWLSLMEYSNKYDVSISTLRRKIRADLIEHDMDNGKYFVPDMDIKEAMRKERNKKLQERRSQPKAKSKQTTKANTNNKAQANKKIPEVKIKEDKKNDSNEAVFLTANRLLDELKKAYTFVLQEKESQIIHLRNELSDLKTLVRVLEDEVMKLRGD